MSDCLTMFEYCMILQEAMQSWNIEDYAPLFVDEYDFNGYIKIEFQDHNRKNQRHTYENPYEFNICILKQLFFIISSFITSPNESYQDNISLTVLKCIESQPININDFPYDIIKNIIVNLYLYGISWDIYYHHNLLKNDDISKDYSYFANNPDKYFKYQLNNSLVIYPNDNIVDSLHIPTTFTLSQTNNANNQQYIFHLCIQKKGDEMWLGLTDRLKFESSCNCNSKLKQNSIIYYGGRESNIDLLNNGKKIKLKSIHGTSCKCSLHDESVGTVFYKEDRLYTNLPSFRSGDWISIVIDHNINNKTFVAFYQNGDLVCNDIDITETVNKSMMGMVLYSIVDSSNDAIYIEQAFNKNGLKMPMNYKKPAIAEKLPEPQQQSILNQPSAPTRILVIDRQTGRPLGYLIQRPSAQQQQQQNDTLNSNANNNISVNMTNINDNNNTNVDNENKSIWHDICACFSSLCCGKTERIQGNTTRYERL